MARLELAPEVVEDFDRILDHLATHHVENPGQRIGEIMTALDVLEQNPLIGDVMADRTKCGYFIIPLEMKNPAFAGFGSLLG